MIAHGFISLGKEYILYKPDMSRWDIKAKLTWIKRSIDGNARNAKLFKLRFDDENYNSMVKAILRFDESLFPFLSKQLWVDYNKLR